MSFLCFSIALEEKSTPGIFLSPMWGENLPMDQYKSNDTGY